MITGSLISEFVWAAAAGLPLMTELYPRAGLSAWSEMETWTRAQ